MKPWRMWRARGPVGEATDRELTLRGTLTLCTKEDTPEERTFPHGNLRGIWVDDRGQRTTFDTSHVEGLDDEELPRKLRMIDTQSVVRLFEVYGELPVTADKIRMVVAAVTVNPKAT